MKRMSEALRKLWPRESGVCLAKEAAAYRDTVLLGCLGPVNRPRK